MPHPPLLTARLRLELYRIEALRRLADSEAAAFETAMFPFRCLDPALLPEPAFCRHRLGLIEADPLQHPWMVRAIVRRDDNLLIGKINFHHRAPNPWLLAYSDHAAELGYSIGAAYRRQGYASEALLGMARWAHEQHAVNDFFVSIAPGNLPSQRMAAKLGFRKVGEQMDDGDGLEHVLRADPATLLA